jgi:hypothetical protein
MLCKGDKGLSDLSMDVKMNMGVIEKTGKRRDWCQGYGCGRQTRESGTGFVMLIEVPDHRPRL